MAAVTLTVTLTVTMPPATILTLAVTYYSNITFISLLLSINKKKIYIFIIRGCHLVWKIIFYSLYYTPYFIFLLYYISLYIMFLILYSIQYIIFLILYPYHITHSFILYSLYYIPIIFLYIIFYGYYIISYSSLSASIICGIDPMLCNWCKTLLCRIKLERDDSFLEHTSHS